MISDYIARGGLLLLLVALAVHFGRVAHRIWEALPTEPAVGKSERTKEQQDIAEAALLLTIMSTIFVLAAVAWLGWLFNLAK